MDITFGFNGGQYYETSTLKNKLLKGKKRGIIGIEKVVSSAWLRKGSQMLKNVKEMTKVPKAQVRVKNQGESILFTCVK